MPCLIFLLLKILVKLVGLGVIGFGIYLAYLTMKAEERLKKSPSWPTAVGTLTESKIVTSYSSGTSAFDDSWAPSGNSTESSHLNIKYEYTVDDVVYTSSRVNVWPVGSSSYRTKTGLNLLNIDIGQKITVYYDPEEPGFAILDPEDKSGFGISVLCSVFAIMIGSFFLSFM